jgi:hypothetical protein
MGEDPSDVEEKLRSVEFDHDMRAGAPRCRWVLGNLTVDIMPTDGAFLGLNTTWFKEALATATEREILDTRLRLVSPVGFLAIKYVAFLDRGDDDYYASQDLEDFVTVIDGRENIVAEVEQAPADLRCYVIGAVRSLVDTPEFDEVLPGQIPPDRGSQQRLPVLRKKLRGIATLNL